MLKKYIVSLLVLVLVIASYFIWQNNKQEIKPVKEAKTEQIKKDFRYRKYLHVKSFYKNIAKDAIAIGLKYNVPPAAILAIAGVESGYARGYVAKITGNIMSLGAKENEAELPALYLPNLKSDKSKILYGSKIKKYYEDDLEWKKRPKSLKKDYRPKNIAGTTKELDYFDRHQKEKIKANLKCIEDFAKNWISKNKKFEPFVKAREFLDEQVAKNSKDILFDKDLNEKFIYMISGTKNSFNHRKTWAPKVIKVMQNVGLVELTKALHVEKKDFDEVW
ncbi:hypothetical protein ACKGJI_10395 [Sulfurospirillum sp. 1307]|jgi:hypothetical protein